MCAMLNNECFQIRPNSGLNSTQTLRTNHYEEYQCVSHFGMLLLLDQRRGGQPALLAQEIGHATVIVCTRVVAGLGGDEAGGQGPVVGVVVQAAEWEVGCEELVGGTATHVEFLQGRVLGEVVEGDIGVGFNGVGGRIRITVRVAQELGLVIVHLLVGEGSVREPYTCWLGKGAVMK